MRDKNTKNYDKLFFLINLIYGEKSLDELLDIIRPCDKIIGYKLIDLIPPQSLDLSFTFGMTMMAQWRDKLKDEIVLIHDQTSNMTKQIVEWKAIMSNSMDQQTIGWDDRRTLNLPINIKETIFSSSKDWAGLQLADILAGVTVNFANWMKSGKKYEDVYGEKLADLMQKIELSVSLLPSTQITPEELGTLGSSHRDPNEVIGEIVYKAKNSST